MYEKKNPEELEFVNFYQPFGGKMDPDNRWIQNGTNDSAG
jgi:hypothetical protein